MSTEKDEVIFRKKIQENMNRALFREIPVYTRFLTLYEQSICRELSDRVSDIQLDWFGGYPEAERRMACFRYSGISNEYDNYPIASIKIAIKYPKFRESLTHRDFLGALMNLGLNRDQLGDILLKDTYAYLFCLNDKADYLCEQLTKVKHTIVECSIDHPDEFDSIVEKKLVQGTISSERIDSILSVGLAISRSSVVPLIVEGKVFVNGKLIQNPNHVPKEGDLLSVRGYGRVKYMGVKSHTKKERLLIHIEKYS